MKKEQPAGTPVEYFLAKHGYNQRVVKVTVIIKSPQRIAIKENNWRAQAPNGRWESLHPTFEAARQEVINRLKAEISIHARRLEQANEELNKVFEMTEAVDYLDSCR